MSEEKLEEFDTDSTESKNEAAKFEEQPRHIGVRILAGIFWLAITYIAVEMLVGAVVGAIAGAEISGEVETMDEAFSRGSNAGAVAAEEFFGKYGLYVSGAGILTYIILLATGKYPWISKYKKVKVEA